MSVDGPLKEHPDHHMFNGRSHGSNTSSSFGFHLDETQDVLEYYESARVKSTKKKSDASTFLPPSSSSHVLLIQGERGVGKTHVAMSIRNKVDRDDDGYFLRGRCDFLGRPEPYQPFVLAFTEFTKRALAKGSIEVLRLRRAMERSLGTPDSLANTALVDMIPALKKIMQFQSPNGEQELSPNLPEGSSHNILDSADSVKSSCKRFVFVFRDFLRSVCSPDHPIVLLVQDLHYADPSSVDLLSSIICDPENDVLVILATYDISRTNLDEQQNPTSVSASSYLRAKLRELQDTLKVNIRTIELRNRSLESVKLYLAESLSMHQSDEVHALASMVHGYTNGNPLKISCFLRWLHDMEILVHDSDTDYWFWDAVEIAARIDIPASEIHNTILVHLLRDRLDRLSDKTAHMLKAAACMGSHVDTRLLEYAVGFPVDEMLHDLAVQGVFFDWDEYPSIPGVSFHYSFAHDYVQECVYGLLVSDNDERKMFHAEIGRSLWRKLDRDELDQFIFTILAQVCIGHESIHKDKERLALASLCLHAGRKAANSSTFRIAAKVLNVGIRFLGGDPSLVWNECYDLALSLYNAAAEMELNASNFDRIDHLLNAVLANAKRSEDTTQALATKVHSLTVSGQHKQAVVLGKKVLQDLGLKLPTHITAFHLVVEFLQVQRLLRGKSNECILRLPLMQDERKLACMHILHLIFQSSMMTDSFLALLGTLRMIRLTLNHGLSVFASCAFANYGMACIGANGSIDYGFRLGELGVMLLEQFGQSEYLPRVYAAFYGFIWSWKKPMAQALGPLIEGYRVGVETGDIAFAIYCFSIRAFLSIDCGEDLASNYRSWQSFEETVILEGKASQLLLAVWPMQSIRRYLGLTPDPLSAKGDMIDDDEFLRLCREKELPLLAMSVPLMQLLIAYVFNDYEMAAKESAKLTDIMIPPTFVRSVVVWVRALTIIAMARKKRRFRARFFYVRRILKQLREWASRCEGNYLCMLLVLEAELLSFQGRHTDAQFKYTSSIAVAREFTNAVFFHACACEHAARHKMRLGRMEEAKSYFHAACLSYEEWGSKPKVDRLKAEMESL